MYEALFKKNGGDATMNWIFLVDRYVFERFERFSHFCQWMFGIMSFVFARIMLIIIVLALSIEFVFFVFCFS